MQTAEIAAADIDVLLRQVAVFDTAFHQTMPASSYMYALPYELYQQHAIRKYGFHGTSHRYLVQQASKLLGRPESQLNLILCHIGEFDKQTSYPATLLTLMCYNLLQHVQSQLICKHATKLHQVQVEMAISYKQEAFA